MQCSFFFFFKLRQLFFDFWSMQFRCNFTLGIEGSGAFLRLAASKELLHSCGASFGFGEFSQTWHQNMETWNAIFTFFFFNTSCFLYCLLINDTAVDNQIVCPLPAQSKMLIDSPYEVLDAESENMLVLPKYWRIAVASQLLYEIFFSYLIVFCCTLFYWTCVMCLCSSCWFFLTWYVQIWAILNFLK